MLQPSKIAPRIERHEEVFLARYTRLRVWALRLTENDRERAEDLVHDAYIQFTFTRPELMTISNLDGYLYTMLRNLHLSQMRRAERQPHRSLSFVDYDSAEIGLRAADPRDQIHLQDELYEVCKYACARKETSKAGSVLILRFMHGYYPGEIAKLMQSTRAAVEERLRIARSEARQYLKNPQSLHFLQESTREPINRSRAGFARTTNELLSEMRGTIFASCQGDCLAREQLDKLYHRESASGIDHATLGHIVSCHQCLDSVNRILDLPLLSERFPTDTLGNDTRAQGGGGGGGDDQGGTTGGRASEIEWRRCRKRARDVFEHRPAELCVSVNGYLLAAQKVGSELNEQTLSINVEEKIDFIEIFSEQDLRLLSIYVEELPHGADRRSVRVQLSDDRTLEATLSFSQPWPTLQVVYCDPLAHPESAASLDAVREASALPKLAPAATSPEENPEPERHRRSERVANAFARFWGWFVNPGFWLRPGTITAMGALILISVLLLTRTAVPVVSAAELLRRSTVAEETAAGNSNIALHRTINLEERRPNEGTLLARHRIEVWQSAAHGIKLRRIYDAQNGLVGGEWRKADGTSTVYRRGTKPQTRIAPEVAAGAILETGELWRLDASAKEFHTLVGSANGVTVQERANTYILSYRSNSPGDSQKLLRATMTLKKPDLHAIEQTLTVWRDGETREYRFIEAGFEQKPASAVAPHIFPPEPELLGPPEHTGDTSQRRNAAEASAARVDLPGHQPERRVASVELEIEVTYLLNQVKANLGEQVRMTRTMGGALRVEALVETERRKEEILRALGPIINHPAVEIAVSTVAEAVKRQPAPTKPREVTEQEIEVPSHRIPADPELRAYYSARLVGGEAIDEEINRYASRVMNRSRQALLRASELKRLVRRLAPAEVRALAPEARAKWLSMIHEQARGCGREIATLRQELRAVFNGSGEAASAPVTEANLAEAADRLLQLSYANDEAVRSAFTISAESRTAVGIKSAPFWRSLATSEQLAEAIQRVYQQ